MICDKFSYNGLQERDWTVRMKNIQMIMAVLNVRYCDNRRKQLSPDKKVNAQRPYSQYFLTYILGRELLEEFRIKLEQLTHINFDQVHKFFTDNKEQLYWELKHEMSQNE